MESNFLRFSYELKTVNECKLDKQGEEDKGAQDQQCHSQQNQKQHELCEATGGIGGQGFNDNANF